MNLDEYRALVEGTEYNHPDDKDWEKPTPAVYSTAGNFLLTVEQDVASDALPFIQPHFSHDPWGCVTMEWWGTQRDPQKKLTVYAGTDAVECYRVAGPNNIEEYFDLDAPMFKLLWQWLWT